MKFFLTLLFSLLSLFSPPLFSCHHFPFEGEKLEVFFDLMRDRYISREGKVETLRPFLVDLQAQIEIAISEMLRKELLKSCYGIIHTPTPPTPLCKDENISEGEPTVVLRSKTVRDLLRAGATLFGAYPLSGLEKRSQEELLTYAASVPESALSFETRKELTRLLGTSPTYLPEEEALGTYLECLLKDLDPHMSGATYFLENHMGEQLLFSVSFVQVMSEAQEWKAEIWYGPLTDLRLLTRAGEVLHTLESEAVSLKQFRNGHLNQDGL